jgi:hypothetical protein
MFVALLLPVGEPCVEQATISITITFAQPVRPITHDEKLAEFGEFIDCMEGPPFLCWPIKLADTDGLIGGWSRFAPSNDPSEKPRVCFALLGSCLKFDFDLDGDVDMRDFAQWIATFWKKPPPPKRSASQTWDGTHANLDYVKRDAEAKAAYEARFGGPGSCGVYRDTCFDEDGVQKSCGSDD